MRAPSDSATSSTTPMDSQLKLNPTHKPSETATSVDSTTCKRDLDNKEMVPPKKLKPEPVETNARHLFNTMEVTLCELWNRDKKLSKLQIEQDTTIQELRAENIVHETRMAEQEKEIASLKLSHGKELFNMRSTIEVHRNRITELRNQKCTLEQTYEGDKRRIDKELEDARANAYECDQERSDLRRQLENLQGQWQGECESIKRESRRSTRQDEHVAMLFATIGRIEAANKSMSRMDEAWRFLNDVKQVIARERLDRDVQTIEEYGERLLSSFYEEHEMPDEIKVRGRERERDHWSPQQRQSFPRPGR